MLLCYGTSTSLGGGVGHDKKSFLAEASTFVQRAMLTPLSPRWTTCPHSPAVARAGGWKRWKVRRRAEEEMLILGGGRSFLSIYSLLIVRILKFFGSSNILKPLKMAHLSFYEGVLESKDRCHWSFGGVSFGTARPKGHFGGSCGDSKLC